MQNKCSGVKVCFFSEMLRKKSTRLSGLWDESGLKRPVMALSGLLEGVSGQKGKVLALRAGTAKWWNDFFYEMALK